MLAAVIAAHEAGVRGERAVIDDVLCRADVARGTFYKYFASFEEAVTECASLMVDEMSVDADPIYSLLTHPASRVATGLLSFLFRAQMDRAWGAFLLQSRIEGDNKIMRRIRSDLLAGLDAGVFSMPSLEAGVDMLLGALRQAVRRIVVNQDGEVRAEDMAAMVLCSFGISGADAKLFAGDACRNLVESGPKLLPWWRPTGVRDTSRQNDRQ